MKRIVMALLSWIGGTFFIYFTAMQWVNIYVLKNSGVILDWSLLFYQNNNRFIYALTLLGTAVPSYIAIDYISSKVFKNGKRDKGDYSCMISKREVKKKMLRISFRQEKFYFSIWDKIEIFLNRLPVKINLFLHKCGVDHIFKLKTLDTWLIDGEHKYKRYGVPFITSSRKVWIDQTPSHSLILGTTNSGKSWSYILPSLVFMAMAGESGLAVDVKGELSQRTASLFKQLGYNVYFLDFLDTDNSDCWNPLYLGAKEYILQKKIETKELQEISNRIIKEKEKHDILNKNSNIPFDISTLLGKTAAGDEIYNSATGDIITNADFSLAQELFRDVVQAVTSDKNDNSKDGFWNDEAARVMEGYIHLLAEEGHIDCINIPSVQKTILSGDQIYKVIGRDKIMYIQYFLEKYKGTNHLSKEILSSYIDSADNTKKSTRNVLAKHLSSITTSEAVKKILSNNTIPLDEIGKKKSIIFLKVHDEKQTYYPLVTLFIKQLWQELVKTARQEKSKSLPIPFNIIFDEMGQFPKFDEIVNILTAGRSRNVRLVAALQGNDQLEEKYGDKKARTIKNNMMNTIYLLSGDPATLEDISKRCGTKRVYENGKNIEKRNITVDRLKEFKLGQALILRQRQGAFLTKLIPFDKYTFYKYLSDYELEYKPKKNPAYFDIVEEIQRRELE